VSVVEEVKERRERKEKRIETVPFFPVKISATDLIRGGQMKKKRKKFIRKAGYFLRRVKSCMI